MPGVVTVLEITAAHEGFALGKRVGWLQATALWGFVSAAVAVLACL